ncbi:MAG: hypothetical protein JW753_00095 [Dehalococcoidia bacterium]|nr:hypothetical protein [Dehalococcoidia bacterium]
MISTGFTVDADTTPLAIAVAAGLIVLLVTSELADRGEDRAPKVLRQHLLAFAVPLLVVFASIAILTSVDWIS